MSLIGAISAYSRLSSEQRAFVKKQGINTSMSAHKWVRFLEPICEFDQQCDPVRDKLGGIAMASGFGLFFSVFLSAFFSSPLPLMVVGVIFILSLFLYLILNSKDVNNNVRNTLFPLLNVLSIELGNRQKINLNICFRKKLKKKDIVLTPRSDKANVFYGYDVVELNCTLKDGTKLTWKVRDLIRKRTKRNPRGKIKVKYKLKRRILIAMSFKAEHYQLAPGAKKTWGKKIKQENGKIVYKNTIKQSAEGKVADVNFNDLLARTQAPYHYLEQAAG